MWNLYVKYIDTVITRIYDTRLIRDVLRLFRKYLMAINNNRDSYLSVHRTQSGRCRRTVGIPTALYCFCKLSVIQVNVYKLVSKRSEPVGLYFVGIRHQSSKACVGYAVLTLIRVPTNGSIHCMGTSRCWEDSKLAHVSLWGIRLSCK